MYLLRPPRFRFRQELGQSPLLDEGVPALGRRGCPFAVRADCGTGQARPLRRCSGAVGATLVVARVGRAGSADSGTGQARPLRRGSGASAQPVA